MKIALCQMEVKAGRPDLNTERMLSMMRSASSNGATLVCFSEMCVPGYMVGDDWEDKAFVDDCLAYGRKVSEAAHYLGVRVVFGNIRSGLAGARYEDGRQEKHNSVLISDSATGGAKASPYDKINLPNYREFDDKRYFKPGEAAPNPFSEGGVWFSTSICEDGWDDDYKAKPIADAAVKLAAFTAYQDKHIHLNLSCSPYTKGKNGARNRRFAAHSELFDALCYVNCVGLQNNGKDVFVFDGGTTVYQKGSVLGSLPPLKECIGYVNVGETINLEGKDWVLNKQEDPALEDVVIYGTRLFLNSIGTKKVVIGLSGGIDSALSTLIHVAAVGAENVTLVNMPSEYNSKTTKGIAKEIALNLKCPYLVVPITKTVAAMSDEISAALAFKSKEIPYKGEGITLENIQARARGAGIQAALASGLGGVFPNNGNKAEVTVGYSTIGGDLMGYLAPLGDLWKEEVYTMAKRLSDKMGGVLPDSIFLLKPSAELSSAQNVEKGQGDPIIYWYHDKLFASWVEPWNRDNIEDSLRRYFDGSLLTYLGINDREADFFGMFPTAEAFISDLERWWKQFKGLGRVKRVQSPPVIVVSRRAFGFDFRESLGGAYFTTKYQDLKKEVLAKHFL